MRPLSESLFVRKSVAAALAEAAAQPHGLARRLGTRSLVFLGVGAVVGAGVFSSIGELAAGNAHRPGAGPALVISFIVTAIACGFAAMAYAEMASVVPVAGSAYTYAYVTLGKLPAWIIGWDLVIEYAIGNIYVAQSWAEYFQVLLGRTVGLQLPVWMTTDVQTAAHTEAIASVAPHIGSFTVAFNLPAAFITCVLTIVLVRGIRGSARVNSLLVLGKLLLLCMFVGVGAFYVEPAHWRPFAPGGVRGVWTAASLAFFSYIGFDAISTAAEEVKDPTKQLPRAMIIALGLCAVIYVLTALVMTGLVPSSELGVGDPLAYVLLRVHLERLAGVMALGAVLAVTAVLLVFQMGQPRILMCMARDGLLPPAFARVHPRFATPAFGTIVTGVFVAAMPSLMTPSQALELTSIGTLFAFFLVSVGVIVLRVSQPAMHRPFRCPGYPWVPGLSALFCVILMCGLPLMNWLRFGVWLLLGLLLFGLYGHRRGCETVPIDPPG
ncbi:MAG: amino acid permease [Deltaproteobacteria bacterium]|nr:amino acid permease [Deltaproteobacteria bacterium]